MINNWVYRQIMLFGLVFLILMGPMEVFSLDDTSEFSDEKEEIIGDSRVLVGYNATLINKSDINFKCWVILKDQGKYDVVWKSIGINSTIEGRVRYEENTTEVEHKKDKEIQKNLTFLTPHDDLTEKDLKLEIIFSFYEVSDEKETYKVILKKNIDDGFQFPTNAFFIGFVTFVLVILGIIKRRRRS